MGRVHFCLLRPPSQHLPQRPEPRLQRLHVHRLHVDVVARGETEVGFQQVAELIHTPGVDFVGTVPAEIQPPTYYIGILTTNVKQQDAAVALLRFLSSDEAAAVISKNGLKPLAKK